MNKPHHFNKTWRYGNTGIALSRLMDKCNEVSEIARQWAEAQGATSYIESPEGIAGGISALEFTTVPDGVPTPTSGKWDRVETPQGDIYYLPKEGSDLEKEMYSLPIVSETEFINILHFKPRINSKGQQLPYTFGNQTPVVFLYNDYWYVDMPYVCEAEDIIAIEEKEFYRRRMAAINTHDQ